LKHPRVNCLTSNTHRAVKVPGPLRDFYLRLKAKKGAKVAIAAVARKLLVLIWTLLTRKEEYREPSRRHEAKARKMERLGGRTRRESERNGGCARETAC